MPSVVQLRDDYDGGGLRALARRCSDPRQVRRLLALAAICAGKSREEAAAIGCMDRQTLRDWAHRFNAGGPEGLRNRRGAGRPRLLTEEQMRALADLVETGPDQTADGVVHWRCIDLRHVLEKRFQVSFSVRSLSRLLAELSFTHISGRPRHPQQDERAIEALKKLPSDARGAHSPSAQGQAGRDLV